MREKGLPWERSKAFDGSAIFSDFVKLGGGLADLRLQLHINDHLVQEGGYDLMMNKPMEVLTEASGFLSFEDGDVIMTGTPKGVGPIKTGDRLHGKIFDADKLLVESQWVVR